MKLLLINPKFQESFWTFSWTSERVWPQKRYPVAPLGLASVAALTPDHWEVVIVDENVEPIDWDEPADVVGVGGMTIQLERQCQILARFRERGAHVVAGGNHASLLPEHYVGLVDTIVSGEAEQLWPRFCRDFENGRAEALYKETGDIDLTTCPTPRYDLLKLGLYNLAAVQFSRGCPFRCEFCDIIVMFGRKPRTKRNPQIRAELDRLREAGVRNVFFVDDNLIGHRPNCKRLLRFLIRYQKEHDYYFHFGTEASIDLAGDAELLRLFRRAHFCWLFVGIESPSEDALRETKKFQNVGKNLIDSVSAIHGKGIHVMAGFIVGFDADDETIFERQFRFILEAGISPPMVGLLTAIPRTPLWARLVEEDRLRPEAFSLSGLPSDNTGATSNIVPLHMTYEQMVAGYVTLMRRLYDERAIHDRLRRKYRALGPARVKHFVEEEDRLGLFLRFLWHGLLAGGPRRCFYFLASLPLSRGRYERLMALVTDWAESINMKHYIDHRFDRRALARRPASGPPVLSRDGVTPSLAESTAGRSPTGD